MTVKLISPGDAARLAPKGARLLLAGSAAEPVAVLDAVSQDAGLWQDVTLTGAFIPGVNERDFSAVGAGTLVETIFTTVGLRPGVERGHVRHFPLHYTDFFARLSDPGHVDMIYATVPPPGPDGRAGLGIAADFVPAALAAGAPIVGLVSESMPDVPGAPRLPLSRFLALADAGDSALPTLPPPRPSLEATAIATHIAGLVPEGGTLQLGLGNLQATILEVLRATGRTDLAYHAGMISPPTLKAFEVFGRGVTTGVALGDTPFYAALGDYPQIAFRPVGETHDITALGALPGFVAVNSAIEVDLTGQVSGETINGRQVSGHGGLLDFFRGARRSSGGLAIVALPSQTRGQSRIVKEFVSGTTVSAPRSDVDMVVTEFGVADLRMCSLAERRIRLMEVANPIHQAALMR